LLALEEYNKAIDQEPLNEVLYSNRSVTNLRLKKPEDALKDADTGISLKPSWIKVEKSI
jgi:hypothetical protein